MALQDGQLAMVVVNQPTPGTVAPALEALVTSGSLNISSGLVLGDTGSGTGESGISYGMTRNQRDTPNVNNDLTRTLGNFLSVGVNTLSMAFQMSGNKGTLSGTPAASEFDFSTVYPGVDQIYKSSGLSGSADGIGWAYNPADAAFVSVGIWDSGRYYLFFDCLANLDTVWTPGELGIHTANWVGKHNPDGDQGTGTISGGGLDTFPTLDYGDQATVASPTVELATNVFGAPRGWSTCTLNIDNGITTTPDCNEYAGQRIEQPQRDISLSSTIDIDSSDLNHDYDNLKAIAVGDLGLFEFNPGVDGAATEPALAYTVSVPGLSVTDYAPDQPARARSSVITGNATSTTDETELEFRFR